MVSAAEQRYVEVEEMSKAVAPKPMTWSVQDFEKYIAGPRNFSVLVTLTALEPRMKCAPCRAFDNSLTLAANSWYKYASNQDALRFATLDFEHAGPLFQQLKIQSVPVVMSFRATADDVKPLDAPFAPYAVDQFGLEVEPLVKYLSQTFNENLIIDKPVPYMNYFMTVMTLLGLAIMIKSMWSKVANILQQRKLWMGFSLGWILLMCSGHMWNSIRGPPYTGFRDNRPEIIAHGFSNQFVLESQIAGVLYATIAFSFVILINRVPYIKSAQGQQLAAYFVIGAFVLFYSILLKMFKMKNGGYPFKLFF